MRTFSDPDEAPAEEACDVAVGAAAAILAEAAVFRKFLRFIIVTN
jgi:hypothetical protein